MHMHTLHAQRTVVESLEGMCTGMPAGQAPPPMPSQYVSGSAVEHVDTGATALVAFETSGWKDVDTAIMTTVVRLLPAGTSCLLLRADAALFACSCTRWMCVM